MGILTGNIEEVEADVWLNEMYEFGELELSPAYFKHMSKLRRSYLMEDMSWWKYIINYPSEHWLYHSFEHFPHMLMFHECKVSEVDRFLDNFIREYFVQKFKATNKELKKKRYTDQVSVKRVDCEGGFVYLISIKYYKYYPFWIKREANLNIGTIYIKTKNNG